MPTERRLAPALGGCRLRIVPLLRVAGISIAVLTLEVTLVAESRGFIDDTVAVVEALVVLAVVAVADEASRIVESSDFFCFRG